MDKMNNKNKQKDSSSIPDIKGNGNDDTTSNSKTTTKGEKKTPDQFREDDQPICVEPYPYDYE